MPEGVDGPKIKQIPGIPEEEQVSADNPESNGSATAETLQLNSGLSEKELRQEARLRDHERSEYFKDHFELITVIGLYVMSIGVFSFAAAWAYHMLTPAHLHWLDADQISRIQNIVTGGVLAGIIADQFRRRLGPKE